MTTEGYDFEYRITTGLSEPWGYGTYTSTCTILCIDVTVDPPAWTCPSCRKTKDQVDERRGVGPLRLPSSFSK